MNEHERKVGLKVADQIERFVKELCDEWFEKYGQLPDEHIGFSMIRCFEEALCKHSKEDEPDAEDTFDPTDFRTICRLGGYRDIPSVHTRGKRADGDVRDLGGKELK